MPRPSDFEQQLVETLDRIYEAPYGDGSWEPALTAIGDLLGAESVDLSFLDQKLLQCTRWEFVRIDAAAAHEYTSNYLTEDVVDVHPRMPVAMEMQEGQVVADADFWTVRERMRKTFFAEYYVPLAHCIESVMGTVRRREDDGPWVVLATHFRSAAPPQHDLRKRVAMLLSHLRRAVEAEAKLAQVHREREALAEALDQVSEPVALLDREGRVMRFNRAAETLLNGRSGLSLARDGRLLLEKSDARAELATGLAQCESAAIWTVGSTVCPPKKIVIRRLEQPPLVLTLQPLPKELFGAYGAVALLFIADLAAAPADRTSALRLAYGLSNAEARLAQSLSEGESLKEFARRREVAYETVRAQLKRVLGKTGTRRQSELVGLVHRLR